MDKLKMQTANQADENYRKLAELFPNAVTETIDENGEVVRAIDKDVLMQEIGTKVVEGKRNAISSPGRTRRNLSCWRTLPFPKRCVQFVMMKQNPPVRTVRENLIVALAAWTSTPPKTSISRVITLKC